MTLWEVIAFLEAQPIEKSWKQLIVSQAGDEDIRQIAAQAGAVKGRRAKLFHVGWWGVKPGEGRGLLT